MNIGWLDPDHSFPTGHTDAAFREKLEKLCGRKFKQTRGFHSCEFCEGDNRPKGSSEIRVRHLNRVYAAPVLIAHYVVVHEYCPPKEFISAVLAWDERNDDDIGWKITFDTDT